MHKFRNADDYADQSTETAISVLKVIGFVILGILFTFLVGFLFQWLWNTLVTDIFDLRMITYWEGIGIIVISKIIFGFGSSGSDSKGSGRKKHRGLVANEIRNEIRKDMLKEFSEKYPDFEEDTTPVTESTSEKTAHIHEQDDLYDKWWEKEGEKHFESYLKKNENSEE